jgi:hypothetical protein
MQTKQWKASSIHLNLRIDADESSASCYGSPTQLRYPAHKSVGGRRSRSEQRGGYKGNNLLRHAGPLHIHGEVLEI